MTRESYEKMINTINSTPLLKKYILFADSAFTKIVYAAYPVLLIFMVIKKEPGLVPALLVPGISFVILSIFRHIYNAKRPYEIYGIKPIINKDSSGKSFPSRHVFSVFIISITMFWIKPILGILMFVIGFAIAVNRVIGGVHFPRDVIAGILFAFFSGIIGFYVIVPMI